MWRGRRHQAVRAGDNLGHSIAVWCSLKGAAPPPGSEPELDLHINLWRLEQKSNGVTVNALDIGLLLSNTTSVECLCLFLPFPVAKSDIIDLGTLLADSELAIAVFNDTAIVSSTASNIPSFSIRLGGGELSCWKLDPRSDLGLESTDATLGPSSTQGTIVTFDSKIFQVKPDDIKRYVRLRINLSKKGQEAFFTRYDPGDRRFLSGYDEIEVVDFRFNETRNLPRAVIDKMTHGVKIREVNYFIIRDMTEDLTLSHSELTKCRTLESYVWTKYLQTDERKVPALRNAIIFGWKKESEKKPIRDYNALARFRKRRTGLRDIFVFIAGLLIIGIVAGIISTSMTEALSKTYSTNRSRSEQAEPTSPATIGKPSTPSPKPSTG